MNTITVRVRTTTVAVAAFTVVGFTASTAAAVPDGDGTSPAPTQQSVRPRTPVPHVVPAFDVATDARPCFRWDGTWNTAEGPQPTCADPGPTVVARPAPQIEDQPCGTTPDIRFVGVPWVTPEATGCASIDRWWDFVPA